MSIIGYTAVERFSPENEERWTKYIAWSGLHQLSQAVTGDGCLCPNVFDEITEEDWTHNIHEDFLICYFRDFDYLLGKIGDRKNLNILGFVHQPLSSFPHGFIDARFQFAGYDLVEKGGSTSALLNCGGFPESFSNSELNESGLISEFERAQVVQRDLLKNNPNEVHANCDLRALWVYLGSK